MAAYMSAQSVPTILPVRRAVVYDEDLRDGGQLHSERDGRQRERVWRFLSVLMRRLDQVTPHTRQWVALEPNGRSTQTQRSRHQERAW